MLNRGKPDASYRPDQWFTTTSEKGIRIDQNRASPPPGKVGEGSVELSVHAGIRTNNSLASRGCCCDDVPGFGCEVWVIPIAPQADNFRPRRDDDGQ
jgi:hypothetical protein